MTGGKSAILGAAIEVDDLAFPRAKALAAYLGRNSDIGATLINARRNDRHWESLVLNVAPDLPQRRVHDIQQVEQMAVVFGVDDALPSVFALREDFPRAPHTNDTPPDQPVSLCLYREPWPEIRLNWTPGYFIQRIRWWLEQTAEGALQAGDHPIEPLFFSTPHTLLIPPDVAQVLGNGAVAEDLVVTLLGRREALMLALHRTGDPDALYAGAPTHESMLIHVQTPVVADGLVRRAPQHLVQLADLLATIGYDLVTDLRRQVPALMANKALHGRRFVLLLAAASTNPDNTTDAASQVIAFISATTLVELAVGIGVYEVHNGSPGKLLTPDMTKRGDQVDLMPLDVGMMLDAAEAATLSGKAKDDRRIVMIGAGSLGSALFDSFARQGFGRWTVIDPDHLKPHNLARHSGLRPMLGQSKAMIISQLGAAILGEAGRPVAIPADVVSPAELRTVVEQAFTNADLIIDATASAAAARAIAHAPSTVRRVSLFFLGDADALAILVEDAARRVRIDDLEALLVAQALDDQEIANLLQKNPTQFATPASCRAPTSRAPWTNIVGLAAIAAERIRSEIADISPAIILAQNASGIGIAVRTIEASAFEQFRLCDWNVRVSNLLLTRLRAKRLEKAPNETGGLLVGSVDTYYKTIHVVGQISDIPDSVEATHMFQRGLGGVEIQLQQVRERSRGALVYLGEWHSHPPGTSASPSATDLVQLAGLASITRFDDRPALSLIVAEAGERLLLGQF